jgi:hypothetical protein
MIPRYKEQCRISPVEFQKSSIKPKKQQDCSHTL